MGTLKDRLSYLWPGETVAAISEKIGMSHMGLSKVFAKNSLPKADTLLNISNISGCDLRWLMTGQGFAFPEKNQETAEDLSTTHPDNSRDFAYISDMSLSGGGLNTRQLAFRHDWLQKNKLNYNNLALISVKDDTMSPTITPNDKLLISSFFYKDDSNRYQTGINPANSKAKESLTDGIYIVSINGRNRIRRLQFHPDGEVVVICDNPLYKSVTLPTSEFRTDNIKGRVEWLGRHFNWELPPVPNN